MGVILRKFTSSLDWENVFYVVKIFSWATPNVSLDHVMQQSDPVTVLFPVPLLNPGNVCVGHIGSVARDSSLHDDQLNGFPTGLYQGKISVSGVL